MIFLCEILFIFKNNIHYNKIVKDQLDLYKNSTVTSMLVNNLLFIYNALLIIQ